MPARGTMPLPLLEQEPLARECRNISRVPAEPSWLPVRSYVGLQQCPHSLTMRTDISISMDVCSALLPATSGGWRKSLRPRSFPGNRRESLSCENLCSISTRISWESVPQRPKGQACFIGMTMDTSREEMTQAVLEGVWFDSGIRWRWPEAWHPH